MNLKLGNQESALLHVLLFVPKINDKCAVTNHGQTSKEMMYLVTHDACVRVLLVLQQITTNLPA